MPVFASPNGNPGQCNTPQLPGQKEAPQPASTPLPPSCFNQHIIMARSPRDGATGRPVLSRTHAYNVPGAQKSCIDHVMRDVNGNPVDLRECLGIPIEETIPDAPIHCFDEGSSTSSEEVAQPSVSSQSSESSESRSEEILDEGCNGFKLIFQLGEYLTCGGVEFPVEVIDAQNGHVRVCLTEQDTQCPGIYYGAFAVVELTPDPDNPELCCEEVCFSNHSYVVIGQSLFARRMCCATPVGPPTIAEVRMHLRDSGPEESYLLDNVAYSDEEIVHAMALPVQYWNEIPPPIGTHTTANFPYRYHWLMATAGYLFLAAAEQQRRNNLSYAAGGVQVNDQNKEPNYEQAAHRRIQEYKEFVRRKKAEINLESAYGGVGSTYSHFSGTNGGFRGSQPYRTWYNY